ncbi:MAG TPA: aminotransferase class V-fold PLP-dependent enzyme, partial [Bacteroidales bacterium]|nr:aminotransferase class V-fold PLP-dependent enzyme [Bacteroidales bacterium]
MRNENVYLDNAATTRPYDEVVQAVAETMQKDYGNPSSLHQLGVQAEEVLQKSREMVAASLQVEPGEVTFTSGGTETNNMVLKGIGKARQKTGKHIIASAIEHKSVLNTLQAMEEDGFEVTYLPVTSSGIVDMDALKEALREDTILVSIMHVNNETGAIQPVDQVADVIRKNKSRALLHSDAVQSYGKISLHP